MTQKTNTQEITTEIVKIYNIFQIDAEINVMKNSGFIKCKRTDNPSKKILYKETEFNKRQKTVYYKSVN